jgi:endonuclease YncB( thermonuclease family)
MNAGLFRIAHVVAVALALVGGAAHADFTGKVVGVIDGDTVDILKEGKAVRVRLAEIDAPESRQAFGQRAKQALSAMVFAQVVDVREGAPDRRWGRVVGTLFVDGRDVNAAMVGAGMAWAWPRYAVRPVLFELQATARQARRGLWSDPQPVPPWEWRPSRPTAPAMASVVPEAPETSGHSSFITADIQPLAAPATR